MAQALGAVVFAVVVMGGLGSIPGALAASLLIGVVQTASISMDMPLHALLAHVGVDVNPLGALADLWQLSVNRAAPVVPYLLLVFILAVHPRGLMGARSA